MDPRAEQLFDKVRQLPIGQRAAFLATVCGGEPALQAEVEALLRAVEPPPSSAALGDTIAPPSPEQTSPEQTGQVIERYKLLQQIGEGGFGTVWMAEQREPVKRRVALKVLKLGMDSKCIVSRRRDLLGVPALRAAAHTLAQLQWFATSRILRKPICTERSVTASAFACTRRRWSRNGDVRGRQAGFRDAPRRRTTAATAASPRSPSAAPPGR